MQLRSNISLLLIVVLLWNISGWLFVGLIQSGTHHHDEDLSHCEISFCYCEVSDEETICTCHHQELHANGISTSHDHDMHSAPEHYSGQMDMCYFSKPDKEPDSSPQIYVHQIKTILSSSVELIPSLSSRQNYMTDNSVLVGHITPLLRPPSV